VNEHHLAALGITSLAPFFELGNKGIVYYYRVILAAWHVPILFNVESLTMLPVDA
jgi:hypothetical protein